MPTFIAVPCPHCHQDQVVKRGKTACGTQRYLCQNQACATDSFLLDYRNRGCLPEVKDLIIDMSLNASGVRDTARSLPISTNTVLNGITFLAHQVGGSLSVLLGGIIYDVTGSYGIPFAISGMLMVWASVAAFSVNERKYSTKYQVPGTLPGSAATTA
jgi:transposase-like protein